MKCAMDIDDCPTYFFNKISQSIVRVKQIIYHKYDESSDCIQLIEYVHVWSFEDDRNLEQLKSKNFEETLSVENHNKKYITQDDLNDQNKFEIIGSKTDTVQFCAILPLIIEHPELIQIFDENRSIINSACYVAGFLKGINNI